MIYTVILSVLIGLYAIYEIWFKVKPQQTKIINTIYQERVKKIDNKYNFQEFVEYHGKSQTVVKIDLDIHKNEPYYSLIDSSGNVTSHVYESEIKS